jgi:hypothetical protein
LIAAKKNKREAKEPSGPLQESRVECSCVGSVTPHGISYQRAAREPYNHTCGRRARGHSKAYNARVGADTIHPRRRAGGSKHSAASAPHGQHKARKGQEYSPTRRPRLYCPPGTTRSRPTRAAAAFSFETAPESSVTFTAVPTRRSLQ